jgi:hypothetical protein
MAKTHYVYSTLSNSQAYTNYTKTPADIMIAQDPVVIAGGANVVDRKHLITPRGVMTKINDDQLAYLEQNEGFLQHKAEGHISVSSANVDVEVAAADMAGRDTSAPLVEQDYDENDTDEATPKPVVNTGKKKAK